MARLVDFLTRIVKKTNFLVKVKRFLISSSVDKYDYLFSRLKPGDLAIDCGANVGEVTRKMAKCGARVYAFEPNPYAFARLRKNLIRYSNVTCINKAVLDRQEKVKLFLHNRSDEDEVYWSTGSSVLDCKGNVDVDKFCEVDAIDLLEFIKNLGEDVAILKIDVEGAECPIINKLIDSGRHLHVGIILVETHDDKIPELKEQTEDLRRKIAARQIENIILDWT